MSGYTGKTLYHRLAAQLSSVAEDQLPNYVREIMNRVPTLGNGGDAPQSHINRMAQSDRGHANPGPGKARNKLGGL